MNKQFVMAAFVMVAACDSPQVYRESDADRLRVADANSRSAVAASSAMADRVERLEERVDDLERELRR